MTASEREREIVAREIAAAYMGWPFEHVVAETWEDWRNADKLGGFYEAADRILSALRTSPQPSPAKEEERIEGWATQVIEYRGAKAFAFATTEPKPPNEARPAVLLIPREPHERGEST